MWKNIVEPDRPQMTIWRVRIVFWITEVTNTRSEYVNRLHISSPLQYRLHEQASLLHYIYTTPLGLYIDKGIYTG
jgi:hypothetical protein